MGEDDGEDVQPKVQVLAKVPARDRLLQVRVGQRDQSGTNADGRGPAQPLELLFFDHAEQLSLHGKSQRRHLVEHNRAAAGQFQTPALLDVGAGEGTALVPEQLAFDQLGRQAGAVNFQQRLIVPRAKVVDHLSQQVLAGAAFAADQHGGGRESHLADDLGDPVGLRVLGHPQFQQGGFVASLRAGAVTG